MTLSHEALVTLEYLLVGFLAVLHFSGLVSGLHALFSARSPQGAIAWVMGMLTMPYVAVPLYWVLGRDRFVGYVAARRAGNLEIEALRRELSPDGALPPASESMTGCLEVLERLAGMPFTGGNQARLLVDGPQTFEAIFEGVAQAKRYVLVQFFIIHNDRLGRRLLDALRDAAARGVRVFCVYDEIGCHALPRTYLDELAAAGVDVRPFNTTKGWRNRFQVNFRNHRKIVVVDGRVAFVGGHNVGDEYMGESARFGPWRDTHVRLEGPGAVMVQLCYLEDWYWASGELIDLDWDASHLDSPGLSALALPSGPADDQETFALALTSLIHTAKRRVWIASPYFVPDKEVTAALQLAALRGVDVRVMLPCKPDHIMVWLAAYSYFPELEDQGVKFYRYQRGFLHQKVALADDELAFVGSANCDTRSFRLNFEITLAVADKAFAGQVGDMLEADFALCRRATAADYNRRWLGFKAAVRLARLLSPIL